MANSKMIGGVEMTRSEAVTRYEAKFYVPDSETATFIPEIGSLAEWAPERAYVTSVSKTWLGPDSWLVSISAEPSDPADIYYKTSSIDDFVEKSFTVGELFFRHAWWGIRIALPSDCPPFLDPSLESIGQSETKYKNIKGSWAVPGDFIYLSALSLVCDKDGNKISDGTAGEPDYTLSPFTTASELPLDYVDQSIKTRIFNCTFNTRRLPQNVSAFIGVSGSFAASCSPGNREPGKWLALSQSVRGLRDSKGIRYTRVTRSMMEAPGDLFWDPKKKGGTWVW